MARFKVIVSGVVQGVGFRPFIYQLATQYNLTGNVCNTSGTVDIEVQGDIDSINDFILDIRRNAPPASNIVKIDHYIIDEKPDDGFKIIPSVRKDDEYQLLSPDIATCHECRDEIFDPTNRRYRYAFTNCTNCGPRFTIINDIPYDRPLTTMKSFKMCGDCENEYRDPNNRRFHAQPNACPICGPHLELIDNKGNQIQGDVIHNACKLLHEGKIIAVKGLGGFLLACNALDNNACKLLRERKHRPAKPFAVMMKSIDEIAKYCNVSDEEKTLLESSAAPIVLLKLKELNKLAHEVAPGLSELGVMLPYTPLHHLLLRETDIPLVMTSGNISEEPIVSQNSEAITELGNIADYLVIHNRDIARRYDDSVTAVFAGEKRIIRRARGYAPFPVSLPYKTDHQILACGSDLKNTFCLTRDNNAFVSQHIGDMENLKSNQFFEKTIEDYKRIFRIKPDAVACDLHPNFFSSAFGRDYSKKENIKLFEIQHHYAHIAACSAENGITDEVLGVALDGTGYGTDGKIWGFEFMKADFRHFTRLAHLQYLPLPGGDAAIKNPIKIAMAYLYKLFGEIPLDLPCFKDLNQNDISLLKLQIDKHINVVDNSSCGRLFDAVSALLNICKHTSYEAEAAIGLEESAKKCSFDKYASYSFESGKDECIVFNVKQLFSEIIEDLRRKVDIEVISYRFHQTISDMIVYNSKMLLKEHDLKTVALSGGCLQNKLLLKMILDGFNKDSIPVITNINLPSNDGCISYGQAVIANALLTIGE
jgi:hydrogenase maturation protein HypF